MTPPSESPRSHLPFRDALASGRTLLIDASINTMIYRRGVYLNVCFEELNASRAHLVKSIHLESRQAGADVLGTNTYGAHRLKLEKYGAAERTRDINLAGARLAREAAGPECWVAGRIGPPGAAWEARTDESRWEDLRAAYEEQAHALCDGGVDVLQLEAFGSGEVLKAARQACRAAAPDLPVIALVHVDSNGLTSAGEGADELATLFAKLDVDAAGLSDGPGIPILLDLLKRLAPRVDVPFAFLPGTGFPVRHEDMTLHLATPEYFMELLRQAIHHGARLVGASCGADPGTIKAIRSSIRMLQPGGAPKQVEVWDRSPAAGATRSPAETPSRMAAKLRAGQFVVSVEIDPPVGTDAAESLRRAAICRDAGVDCINIADGPRASARMGPVDMAMLLKLQVPGIEPIVHFCCRDRNLLGMQADLIGANALAIHNILMITGDPPKLGDYPNATAVYDVDAIGALGIGSKLNGGTDLAGTPLKGDATKLFLGCGANPGAIDLDEEVDRLHRKIDAGAEYILTQPVYELELFQRFHERVAGFGVPILVGILPLTSFRNAEFLHNEVPGMQVPLAVRERMRARADRESAQKEGIDIAREALEASLPLVQGTYVMPPFNRVDLALAVLEAAAGRMAAAT